MPWIDQVREKCTRNIKGSELEAQYFLKLHNIPKDVDTAEFWLKNVPSTDQFCVGVSPTLISSSSVFPQKKTQLNQLDQVLTDIVRDLSSSPITYIESAKSLCSSNASELYRLVQNLRKKNLRTTNRLDMGKSCAFIQSNLHIPTIPIIARVDETGTKFRIKRMSVSDETNDFIDNLLEEDKKRAEPKFGFWTKDKDTMTPKFKEKFGGKKSNEWKGGIGLFGRVKEAIEDETDYELILEDNRSLPQGKPFEITRPEGEERQYQTVASDLAIEKKRGIIAAATGAGKTLIAGNIIAKLGQDTVYYVPNKSILATAEKQFTDMTKGKDVNIGVLSGEDNNGKMDDKKVDINIVSIQYANSALNKEISTQNTPEDQKTKMMRNIAKESPVVFFDETHHLAAETFEDVSNHTASFYRFGLSATPKHYEGGTVSIVSGTGDIIVNIPAMSIAPKWIVPPQIVFINNSDVLPSNKEELSQNLKSCNSKSNQIQIEGIAADASANYRRIYKGNILCNNKRNQRIADLATILARKGKSTLVLVNAVDHAEKITDLLKKQGINALMLTGETEDKIDINDEDIKGLDDIEQKKMRKLPRIAAFNRMRDRRIDVMVATHGIIGEGVDIPTIETVILADAKKSYIQSIQNIGRALRLDRKNPRKNKAVIFDFVEPIKYLGEWQRDRKEYWEEECFPMMDKVKNWQETQAWINSPAFEQFPVWNAQQMVNCQKTDEQKNLYAMYIDKMNEVQQKS